MKTRNFSNRLSLVFIAMVLVFASCTEDKDSADLTNTEVEVATDDAFADVTFEDVDGLVEDVIADLSENNYETNQLKSGDVSEQYESLQIDSSQAGFSGFPKTVTIDFGEGYTIILPDGDTIVKSGKILITVTNPFWISGAQRIINFEKYTVNGVLVEGTRTITNTSDYANMKIQADVTLQNGRLTVNDTLQYTRESSRTREWIRAATWMDDVILVTIHNTSGKNFQGYNYSRATTEPLKLMRCSNFRYRWTIVEGTVDCDYNGKYYNLSYGNGNCDRAATITNENGESRTFRYRNGNRFKNFVRNR
jgi:hypothetical protein